eukprot:Em0059g17a
MDIETLRQEIEIIREAHKRENEALRKQIETLLREREAMEMRNKELPLQTKCNATISLFSSSSSTGLYSEEDGGDVVNEDYIPAQRLLEGVAASKGKRVLQLTNSSPKKMHYMEARSDQGRRHISKGCVAGEACDLASKASAGATDFTSDVTCLACDMQENSSAALPLTSFKAKLPEDRNEGLSFDNVILHDSDYENSTSSLTCSIVKLPLRLLTSTQASLPHYSSHKDCFNAVSTFIVPPFGTLQHSSSLALSPIQCIPQVEGIPLTDSQCLLDTTETPPLSPIIESSKHELKRNLTEQPNDTGLGTSCLSPHPNDTGLGSSCLSPQPNDSGLGTSVDQTHTPDEETWSRNRRRGLKQTTLTQVLPDGSLSLDSPNIVSLTPVVRPVDVILSSPRNNIFFGSNKEDRGEREEDQAVVLPSKQQWESPDFFAEEEEGRSQQQNLQGGDELEEERIEQEKEQEEERENTRIKNERDLQYEYAKKLAKTAGLPTYKFDVPIRKKADRDKLDAKACPDCQKVCPKLTHLDSTLPPPFSLLASIFSCLQWFSAGGGIHRDQREHLKLVCRHKHLYIPPDTDPRIWNISFPDSEECDRIMRPKK